MNKFVTVGAAVALITSGSVALAAAKGPYEIKSGMLETHSEAFGPTTTQEYFDDYGVKSAKYTTTTVMGTTTHKLEIHLPDGSSYDIDLDQKTGTLMRMPPEAAAAMGAAMAPQMMKGAKITALPGKQILGHSCDGKQFDAMGMTTRVWSWKGLPLQTEMGTIVITASKLSEGAVPAEKFAVPAGIRIENIGR